MYNDYPLYGNNYPVPYQNVPLQNPYQSNLKGFTTGVTKTKFNWSQFLNNTQRTLGIINQAIPIVYQIRPILSNAKTMLRIASAIDEATVVEEAIENKPKKENEKNGNTPQFFL